MATRRRRTSRTHVVLGWRTCRTTNCCCRDVDGDVLSLNRSCLWGVPWVCIRTVWLGGCVSPVPLPLGGACW
eukprot:5275294-Alexandrium_andersonii.AAC.1